MGKTAKRMLITGIVMIISSVLLYISGSFGTLATVLLTSGLLCSVVGTPYINGVEYPQIQREQYLKRQSELNAKRNYVMNNPNFKCRDVPSDLNKTEVYLVDTGLLPKEKTWDDVMYTEEEIHQYMQMSESPAPFNPETIFGTDEASEKQNTLHQKQSGRKLVKKLDKINK